MLSPFSLPCLVPQAAYLSASVFTLQTFVSQCLSAPSLHHPCPCWTYLTGCRTFLFLLAPAWLPLPVCCWPTDTMPLSLSYFPYSSILHLTLHIQIHRTPLITDITYLLEHSHEPLPSLSSFFSPDPVFQFNSSCFHRLCLFQRH